MEGLVNFWPSGSQEERFAVTIFHLQILLVVQENKNIKNVKRCRDGMPKSMQTR